MKKKPSRNSLPRNSRTNSSRKRKAGGRFLKLKKATLNLNLDSSKNTKSGFNYSLGYPHRQQQLHRKDPLGNNIIKNTAHFNHMMRFTEAAGRLRCLSNDSSVLVDSRNLLKVASVEKGVIVANGGRRRNKTKNSKSKNLRKDFLNRALRSKLEKRKNRNSVVNAVNNPHSANNASNLTNSSTLAISREKKIGLKKSRKSSFLKLSKTGKRFINALKNLQMRAGFRDIGQNVFGSVDRKSSKLKIKKRKNSKSRSRGSAKRVKASLYTQLGSKLRPLRTSTDKNFLSSLRSSMKNAASGALRNRTGGRDSRNNSIGYIPADCEGSKGSSNNPQKRALQPTQNKANFVMSTPQSHQNVLFRLAKEKLRSQKKISSNNHFKMKQRRRSKKMAKRANLSLNNYSLDELNLTRGSVRVRSTAKKGNDSKRLGGNSWVPNLAKKLMGKKRRSQRTTSYGSSLSTMDFKLSSKQRNRMSHQAKRTELLHFGQTGSFVKKRRNGPGGASTHLKKASSKVIKVRENRAKRGKDGPQKKAISRLEVTNHRSGANTTKNTAENLNFAKNEKFDSSSFLMKKQSLDNGLMMSHFQIHKEDDDMNLGIEFKINHILNGTFQGSPQSSFTIAKIRDNWEDVMFILSQKFIIVSFLNSFAKILDLIKFLVEHFWELASSEDFRLIYGKNKPSERSVDDFGLNMGSIVQEFSVMMQEPNSGMIEQRGFPGAIRDPTTSPSTANKSKKFHLGENQIFVKLGPEHLYFFRKTLCTYFGALEEHGGSFMIDYPKIVKNFVQVIELIHAIYPASQTLILYAFQRLFIKLDTIGHLISKEEYTQLVGVYMDHLNAVLAHNLDYYRGQEERVIKLDFAKICVSRIFGLVFKIGFLRAQLLRSRVFEVKMKVFFQIQQDYLLNQQLFSGSSDEVLCHILDICSSLFVFLRSRSLYEYMMTNEECFGVTAREYFQAAFLQYLKIIQCLKPNPHPKYLNNIKIALLSLKQHLNFPDFYSEGVNFKLDQFLVKESVITFQRYFKMALRKSSSALNSRLMVEICMLIVDCFVAFLSFSVMREAPEGRDGFSGVDVGENGLESDRSGRSGLEEFVFTVTHFNSFLMSLGRSRKQIVGKEELMARIRLLIRIINL